MKTVKYTDKHGVLRASMVRDDDSDELAPQGIPVGIDLIEIDCETIMREISEMLIQRNIFDWGDVQHQQNAVTSTVMSVVRRQIIALFRQRDREQR